MSFGISSTLDSEKVFLVALSETAGRLDPSFHRPLFQRLRARLDSSSFTVLSLGELTGRIFQGVGRNLVEGAPTCLLKVKNITADGEIDFSDTEPVADAPKSKLLQPGDIISPFIGAAIKGYKFARFEGSEQPCTVDNNTGVIRITDSRISSEYLHAFCQTGIIRWQLDQLTGGGGVPFLGSEYARRIRLPLPPAEVQETAVRMMRAAKVRKNDAEAKASALLRGIDDVLLEELGIPRPPEPPNTLASRIFQRTITDLTGSRWDPLFHQADIVAFVRSAPCGLHRLGSLVTHFSTGFAAGRGDQVDEDESGIIQIRPTNLSDDRELGLHRNVYIAREELLRRKADVVRRGEVLFNNTNSQEQVGKTVFFDLGGEYFCSNHITRIGANAERLDAEYLTYLLNLYQRRRVFYKVCTNWNNQSGVGPDVLSRLEIPLPPLKRQREIVQRLDAIRAQARALREQARADLEAAKREIEALILGQPAPAA